MAANISHSQQPVLSTRAIANIAWLVLLGIDEMITKNQFDKLGDSSISVKEHNEISFLIYQRVIEIVYKVAKIQGRQISWFDYGNNEDGNEGFFDIVHYRVTVEIDGQDIDGKIFSSKLPFCTTFPTKWLWEDFESEVTEATKKYFDKIEEKKSKQKIAYTKRKSQTAFFNTVKNKLKTMKEEELQSVKAFLGIVDENS